MRSCVPFKMATNNNVLLGVVDSAIRLEDDEDIGWYTNKFGGKANWMEECMPDDIPSCSNCSRCLIHIAQIYCPLVGSEYHRTLNVFGCLSPKCHSKPDSWKVLRSQCKDIQNSEADETTAKEMEPEVDQSWCDDADDWGDDPENMEIVDAMFKDLSVSKSASIQPGAVNPGTAEPGKETKELGPDIANSGTEASIISKAGIENIPEFPKINEIPKVIPYFTPYYVSVLEEPKHLPIKHLSHEQRLLEEYEQREGPLMTCNKQEKSKEKYEKSRVADGDTVFHQFQKRVKRCPEQCLRYKWNGKPLLFSNKSRLSSDLDRILVCSNCQSERVFEMQLMPALSWLLKVPSELDVPNELEVPTELDLANELNVPNESKVPDRSDVTKTIESDTDISQSTHGHQHRSESTENTSTARDVMTGNGLPKGDISSSEKLLEIRRQIEFGCLYIYSCGKSCTKTRNNCLKPVEEYLVFQPLPDSCEVDSVMKF